MITFKMIIQDLRTYVGMAFWLIGWILNIPSVIFYSISKLIKNNYDNFPY